MNKYPDFTNYGYQISKELGRNLQSGRITYLAKSITSNRQVAIKEFRFALADGSWSAFKAYQREISALKQLKHSQIPCYLESFETESGFCLVTEYIHAPCLAERHIFTPEEVKQIAISVLEILVYLQNFQPPIIHRDIKPENILVNENLQVYLVDFGLAKLRGGELALSSIAAGTPGFMPPEEMFNRPLSNASDLYSLGATLICLLTGTISVEVDKLLDEDYRFKFEYFVPNLHWRFTKWLTKMVEIHPKRRYENAVLALRELKEIPVVEGEEIFAFREEKARVDKKFVDGEIPVVLGRERFTFREDEVQVNQEVIGVAEQGEIFATRRVEIKDNKKVAGVVENGEIFPIGKRILKDKKKFVGVLGIAAIVGILAGKTIISLVGSLGSINLDNQTQMNMTLSPIERIQSTRECGGCDLKNVNLEYADLKGANLENANLKGANLKNVFLDYANLKGANLEGANLQSARLENANLEGTKLDNANLLAAFLLDANLQNTNLKNTNIVQSTIKGTSINKQTILTPKARLVWQIVNNKYQGLNLKKAKLSDAFLSTAKLENIDFEDADLEKSVVYNTILSGANLKNVNLKNAWFEHATLENTYLQGANLQNTRFAATVNLRRANFEGANLANADFNINYPGTNIDLEEANLKNANLENADLSGVNLKNANLTGANIQGADFTGANLEGATMPDGSIYNGKIDN
ncbi:MAG: protein kinase [Okeania sp. SIO2F4]|uniref:serine/threonine-protein kinase n=1 Tax=Okeania sp. SIO2F4 TaxID=2607790 RepID=UPI0014295CFB|nr:serine/threonine-protein kinase [Okeania sp. SIO2F4]NES07940.1 protein kinase [Okeania sp. SIO2F4]